MQTKRISQNPRNEIAYHKKTFIFAAIIICLVLVQVLLVFNDKFLWTNRCSNNVGDIPSNTLKFVKYTPSEYETQWVENIHEWQEGKKYCQMVTEQRKTIETFLEIRDQMTNGASISEVHAKYGQNTTDYIFSKFEYQCGQEKLVSYIEPLFTSLRHPMSYCFPNDTKYAGFKSFLSREYIVLDDKLFQMKNDTTGRFQSCLNAQRAKNPSEQPFDTIYFDIGASYYDQGIGGPSQKWLIENYDRSNIDIQFNRILLWEAVTLKPARIFNIPIEVMPYYQYFNIPAVTTANDSRNPFNLMKKLVRRKTDYVMVKLDMDHPTEFEFVEKILREPQLQEMVDEMFFEHHVAFSHGVPFWGKHNHDPTKTLSDSYNVFGKLRQSGIRMHGWP